MGWDTTELKRRFSLPQNRDVLSFLKSQSPSAHSDVAQELMLAGESMPEYEYFCPDGASCSYLFLHTRRGVIYALAYDMREFCLRLSTPHSEEAVSAGAKPLPRIGPGWVSFDPFLVGVPEQDRRAQLKGWCLRAYYHARQEA